MIATIAATALMATYACEIEPARSLREAESSVHLNVIGLPPDIAAARKFTIEVSTAREGELPLAKINWSGDPMNIVGEFPAIPTAPGAFTLMAFSGGPCLFTELACAAIVQVVEQKSSPAKLLILPAAISTDDKTETREPFVAVIEGKCTKGSQQ